LWKLDQLTHATKPSRSLSHAKKHRCHPEAQRGTCFKRLGPAVLSAQPHTSRNPSLRSPSDHHSRIQTQNQNEHSQSLRNGGASAPLKTRRAATFLPVALVTRATTHRGILSTPKKKAGPEPRLFLHHVSPPSSSRNTQPPSA